MRSPADISLADSVLLPGQVRGGDFKPHGGLRFDSHGPTVDVVAPLSGEVIRVARYLGGGYVQHMVDILSPCGLLVQLDHLDTMAPALAALFADAPPPTEGDSRTRMVTPPFPIIAGEVVAASVGTPGNSFFDFGLYDLRKQRTTSPDPEDELAPYGVCSFEWLAPPAAASVSALPISGPPPHDSAYCE